MYYQELLTIPLSLYYADLNNKKMKQLLNIQLLVCMFLFSCNSRDIVEKEYEQLISDTICLCLDQMLVVSYDSCDIPQVKSNCMSNRTKKMVIYADISLCTSCYIKQMPNWYSLINEVKRDYGNSVEFCFIINCQKQELDDIFSTLKYVSFDYPSFVDTSSVFRKVNKNIPENNLFHCFLLDETNSVVMVGNPQQNSRIKELLSQYLAAGKKNH